MSGIVCAVRGGPTSQPTIEKAISLAADTGLTVFFLYIVNLDFLSRTTSSRTHTINSEMEQMGEFILLAAQNQAMARQVKAEGVVRHGTVSEEIIAYCKETGASYLVLGRPKLTEDEDKNVFTMVRLNEFAGLIHEQTGAVVVLPDLEEP